MNIADMVRNGLMIATGAGVAGVAYGAAAGEIWVTVLSAGCTVTTAIIGILPKLQEAALSESHLLAEQIAHERGALLKERAELLASFKAEIARQQRRIGELEMRLAELEKECDLLADKLQAARRGEWSDTDLEVARILNERRRQREQEGD